MTNEVTSLVLAVDSRQVGAASAALDRFASSGRRAESVTSAIERSSVSLGRALGPVAYALSAAQVIRYADAYQQVNARLRLVTRSQEQYNQVQGELVALADRTRVSLIGTVDLYGRIARSTKDLAATDRDRLQVTEAINKALIVSGATGASAEAALVQLGQGLASGTLRGEELNSVLEQTPRLAQAIADGLGVPLGKLRELGQAGQLTSQQVFRALQSQRQALDAEFNQIPVTIGQALQVAENKLQAFIGGTSEATGAGRAMARAILTVANNIDILTAAAAGFASIKVAQVLVGISAGMKANVVTTLELAAAQKAQAASAVAAAAAQVDKTAASLAEARAEAAAIASKAAGLEITKAAIIEARAETAAKLASAQAAATQAAAQINAAKAAGALSFALSAQRDGATALAAAQARQVALTTQLATLGRQQASVQAQITAATTASTAATAANAVASANAAAAQRGLSAAQSAAAASAGVMSRALGLLGGPIGAIITLLGVGATAWTLWGNSAREAIAKTNDAIKDELRNTIKANTDQVGKLDAAIAKSLAAGFGADSSRVKALQQQRDSLQSQINSALGQVSSIDALATRDQLRAIERGNSLDLFTAGKRDAFKKFMEDNATDSERFKKALAEAKLEMGEFFTPEVEARLRAKFFPKGAKAPAADVLGFDISDIQRSLSTLTSAYAGAESILEANRQAALVDEKSYYTAKRAFIDLNRRAEVDALKAENARLAAEKGNAKERLENQRKIADNEAKIAIINADAAAKVTVLGVQQESAAKAIVRAFEEAEAAAQDYLDTLIRAQRIELGGLGLGSRERDRRQGRQQIEDTYGRQRQQLEQERLRGTFVNREDEYRAELDRIQRFQDAALSSYDEFTAQRSELDRNWALGATEALNNYLAETENAYRRADEFFNNVFKRSEDALTELLTKGKFDIKAFGDFIATELSRNTAKNLLAEGGKLISAQAGKGGFVDTIGKLLGPFFGGGKDGAPGSALTAATATVTAQSVTVTGFGDSLFASLEASYGQVQSASDRLVSSIDSGLPSFEEFFSGLSGAASGLGEFVSGLFSGGGGGDLFGSVLSGLFGGGRANGGPVSAGKMYEVNERGPETLTIGARQYLMMGKESGRVTPAPRGGNSTINSSPTYNIQGPVSRRTVQQMAAAQRRELETASRRRTAG